MTHAQDLARQALELQRRLDDDRETADKAYLRDQLNTLKDSLRASLQPDDRPAVVAAQERVDRLREQVRQAREDRDFNLPILEHQLERAEQRLAAAQRPGQGQPEPTAPEPGEVLSIDDIRGHPADPANCDRPGCKTCEVFSWTHWQWPADDWW